MFNADISADLRPGTYALTIMVRDQNKQGVDSATRPFTVGKR